AARTTAGTGWRTSARRGWSPGRAAGPGGWRAWPAAGTGRGRSRSGAASVPAARWWARRSRRCRPGPSSWRRILIGQHPGGAAVGVDDHLAAVDRFHVQSAGAALGADAAGHDLVGRIGELILRGGDYIVTAS